ncbi:hypothetical protein ACFLRN_08020 [Thermoproteota archaeon]
MLQQRTKSKEKPLMDPEKNMASTSQKCPEMTQSMLEKKKLV